MNTNHEEEVEIFQEMLATQKTVLKIMIEDNELRQLNSKSAKLALDAYTNEGFSREEAIKIICASFQARK